MGVVDLEDELCRTLTSLSRKLDVQSLRMSWSKKLLRRAQWTNTT
jgi:hypothetical protein